jgi:hypothetical protein
MAIVKDYTSFGGVYPETAAFANILRSAGVISPHTQQPFTEAMLLGISGGLGVGYILWEFQEHNTKVLVLAFHNRWQYPIDWYQILANRLDLRVSMPETGGKKAAVQALDDALDSGLPAIAWVDRASMPYFQLPDSMKGHIGHFISICGREDGVYLVDDLAAQPFRVDTDSLAEARGRIGSYKNRLLVLEEIPDEIDVAAAVRQGLQDCVDHLSSGSASFSLPAIRKWAKTMTDPNNKKGWPKVFENRLGLFSTLISLFEAIELNGALGGLRGLYADFLVEAADVLDHAPLKEVARVYTQLAGEWKLLAEEALPSAVPLFQETKSLLYERDHILKEGGDSWRATAAMTDKLRDLRREGNLNIPLNDQEISDLFTRLQFRLNTIYRMELEALSALKAAVG